MIKDVRTMVSLESVRSPYPKILNPDKMRNQINKIKVGVDPRKNNNLYVRLLAHMDKRKLSLGLEISDQI